MRFWNHHKFFIYFSLITFNNLLIAQETILNTNFLVRDFEILDNNTLIYIEKRNIKSIDLSTKTNDETLIDKKGFFIGGYGLKINFSKDQKKIITASNELIRNRSSIRFYDIKKKAVNKYHVLYSKHILDFYISPKDSLFFLSHKDSTIETYQYGKKPLYKKVVSINTKSFSRKVIYNEGNIYYITDDGRLSTYNLESKAHLQIYKTNLLLVNFQLDKQRQKIYISTSTGEIIVINLKNKTKSKLIKLGDVNIEAIEILNNNYLITGDWKGNIRIINLNTLNVKKNYKTKGRIIKIFSKCDYFYTSSSNRKIEKWNFKTF